MYLLLKNNAMMNLDTVMERSDNMVWPAKKNGVLYAKAKIIRIKSDEAGGELFMRLQFNEWEEWDIFYEGVYYSQLDESAIGLTIQFVTEITPTQFKLSKRKQAMIRLYDDCCVDDDFIKDMYRRGNRLFKHNIRGGEYIVLAKKIAIRRIIKYSQT